MVKREIYSVGLKRKVEADVQEIIATPSRGGGFRYQVVGIFTDEDGKEHKCQSMIGKADAESVAASIGQSLPTTEAEFKEAEVVESFAAEDEASAEPELLVPEPSTSPYGDGRVLGQHTGGEIIAATDDSQSLPAHDYVFIGRAEEMPNEEALDAGIEAGKEDMKMVDGKKNCGCGKDPCITYGAEGCDAEFVDVIDSVKNVWNEYPEGTETFVVEENLKDYLIEEFYEDTFMGTFVVEEHDKEQGLWEVTFPYFLSEDIIDAIAEYQTYEIDDDGYIIPTDADLAEMGVGGYEPDVMNARGLVDSDDLFDKRSGISRSTAAIATAVIALSAAYLWSQRK